MEGFRVNRSLVVYTLIIFLAGIFCGGFWLTVNGYDVPWSTERAEAAEDSTNIQPTSTTIVGSDTIQKIVEEKGPAVVKIETVVQYQGNSRFNDPFFREFFGDDFLPSQPRQTSGLGSGFIISKDGYILTNYHVIDKASEVKVYLTNNSEPYTAKIVGADPQLDLAVIKISAGNNLPVLTLGDSNDIKVGNWVIAIGNPYGLDHTVTVGVISAKGRPIQIENREFKDLIQTDASINPGNSGGPLLNLKGEVVGINTAINAQAQGIGFAIPSGTVKQVLDDLLTKGKVVRPWLGVYMQEVTQELADYFGLDKPDGVLINSVRQNSPADKAGLQRGDIILEYNGKHISNAKDLQSYVKESKVGDKVTILIMRQKQSKYVTVTIGEMQY